MTTAEAENRVALITGGGKGVGAGIARRFAREGIRCCVNYHSSADMAQKTLEEILAAGGDAFLYRADVSLPEEVAAMVAAVIERYGRLDILVNNAAMQPNLAIDEYDRDRLTRLWNINIGGYWRVAKSCLPWLRKSPMPRIINISSIHCKRPTVFDAGYAMTKGAIRMFTRELALELMPDGIPVNEINLGGCKIEYKTGRAPFRTEYPLRISSGPSMFRARPVLPSEVGSLAMFLISEDAQTLVGDGIRQDLGSNLT